MDRLDIYIPTDRRQALMRGIELPDHTTGTALFADISGFTPLAEALARELGSQRGAEELTRYLNQVYDVLIAEVDHYGGSVVGFSGDAITCWFDNDNGLRATTCSLIMQRAMEQFRGIRLSSGSIVSLAVKCAVASGPVRRFIVGDPTIQLIDTLAGATLDQLAATEHQARRGEVVLSPESAAALAKEATILEWRTDEETGKQFGVAGKLTKSAEIAAQPLLSQVLNEDQVKPWLLAPIYERVLRGDAYLAELRSTVALFARFGRIDYDHDPEAGQKLNAFISWVQGVLTRYGGFLLDLTIGDKGSYLYATFGAPISYDDNSARAAAAARLLLTPPASLNYITTVQIGLSEGQMRAGPYGGSTRRVYGVIGDDVNLAARLMQLASSGQVVVSKRTADRLDTRYRFKALGSVNLKGKQDSIPVFELLDSSVGALSIENEDGQSRKPKAGMIGRTTERALLSAQLAKLLTDHVSVTTIIAGEAGIGKSRLVEELLNEARSSNVTSLTGSGDAIEKLTPYHAWRNVFIQLFTLDPHALDTNLQIKQVLTELEVDPDLLELAPLLNPVMPFELPDNDLTSQMVGQVRADNTQLLMTRLLQRAADKTPLVVIMEDAHWLDSASWALLLAIKQGVQPVLQVISTRPLSEPLPTAYQQLINQSDTQRLDLEPLPADDIEALICNRLDVIAPLPTPVSSLIREKAEGHPFFSEELAYALRDAGLITLQDHQCRIAPNVDFKTVTMPDTVQGVITSRIDRLPVTHQLTLKAASVIGRLFVYRLLLDIHPLESDKSQLPNYLGELQQIDMTLLETPEPDLAYFFKHAITQEVAYNLMLFAQRRDLHRAIAEWYERNYAEDLSPHYPLLAYHWDKAEVAAKAIEYLDQAGEQAQRSGAYREGINFFSRAIELEDQSGGVIDPVRRAHWLRLMGEALLGIGNMSEARTRYLQGLAALKAPMPVSLPGLGMGISIEMARQFMHRILPKLFLGKARDPRVNREASRLYVKLAQIDYFRNETMLMMYEGLSNLNVSESLGPSLELAGGYASMGLICGFIPVRNLAENYMSLSRATIEAGNQPAEIGEIYEYFALYQSGAGQIEAAHKAFQYAVDAFERIGDKRLWEENATLLSQLLLPKGELDRSLQLREQLYAVGLQRGSPSTQCWALLGQAEITILRDQFEHVFEWLEKARPLAEKIGVGEKIWHQGLLARAYWRQGKHELAEQAASLVAKLTAKATPVNFYALEGYGSQVEVYMRMLESQAGSASLKKSALQSVKAMEKFARVFPLGESRALIWKGVYQWLTGKADRAHALWQAGLSAAEQRAIPYDQALAHYEIGRHLKADDPKRRQHLQTALEIFDQLGTAYDRAATQSALDHK